MHKWLPLIVALVLNAQANVLMKLGANAARPLAAGAGAAAKAFNFLNPLTLAAIALFAGNVLFYRRALDGMNVSVAYPVMVSGGLVLVTLQAMAIPALAERLSLWQAAGIALIGAGVWLVGRG